MKSTKDQKVTRETLEEHERRKSYATNQQPSPIAFFTRTSRIPAEDREQFSELKEEKNLCVIL